MLARFLFPYSDFFKKKITKKGQTSFSMKLLSVTSQNGDPVLVPDAGLFCDTRKKNILLYPHLSSFPFCSPRLICGVRKKRWYWIWDFNNRVFKKGFTSGFSLKENEKNKPAIRVKLNDICLFYSFAKVEIPRKQEVCNTSQFHFLWWYLGTDLFRQENEAVKECIRSACWFQ